MYSLICFSHWLTCCWCDSCLYYGMYCIISYYVNLSWFLLHSPLSGCLGCLQFFAIAGPAALSIFACDYWDPQSSVSLGSKVSTFPTCIDKAKLIFQRGSQLPIWSQASASAMLVFGFYQTCWKGSWGRAREKPLSLQCCDPHFRSQDVTTGLGDLENLPLWLGQVLLSSQAPLRAPDSSKLGWPTAKKPSRNQLSGFN